MLKIKSDPKAIKLGSLLDALRTRNYKNALNLLSSLREFLAGDNEQAALAELDLLEAVLKTNTGKPDEALEFFDKAQEKYTRQNRQDLSVKAAICKVRVLLQTNRIDEAREILEASMRTIKRENIDFLKLDSYLVNCEILFLLALEGKVKSEEYIEALEQLINYVEYEQQADSSLFLRPRILQKYDPYESIISLTSRLQWHEKMLDFAERARSRDFLRFQTKIYPAKRVNKERKTEEQKLRDQLDRIALEKKRLILSLHPFKKLFLQDKESFSRALSVDLDRLFPDNQKVGQIDNLSYSDKFPRSLWNSLEMEEKSLYQKYIEVQKENGRICSLNLLMNAPRNFSLTSVEASLDRDTLVVHYFCTAERLIITAISSEGTSNFEVKIKEKEIRKKVKAFLAGIRGAGETPAVPAGREASYPGSLEEFKKISRELYEILFGQIKTFLENRKRICILPHKSLFFLPFAAMWDGNKYLVKDHAIFYLPLLSLLKRSQVGEISGSGRFTGFAEDEKKLEEEITQLFENSEIINGENISRDHFGKKAAQSDFLLLDTPLEIDKINPLLSRFSAGGEKINFFDLMDLDLRLFLLTIPSFPSYEEMPSGSKRFSLLTSLFYSGANAILVGDGEDKKLKLKARGDEKLKLKIQDGGGVLIEFYRNLKSMDKAEALQKTQVGLIESGEYSHPFFWALFHLYGNFRAVEFEKATREENEQLFRLKWRFKTGGKGSGCLDDKCEQIFVGSEDNYLYALNAHSGYPIWKFKTGDWLTSSSQLYDDTLYFGGLDKKLYAIDVRSGKRKWSFKTKGWICASPLVTDNYIYFGSSSEGIKEGALYALKRATGEVLWEFHIDDGFTTTPTLSGHCILIGGQDGHIYCLNSLTGILFWRFRTGGRINSTGSVLKETFYVGSGDSTLYAVNISSGGTDWKFLTRGDISVQPLIHKDLVIFGSHDTYVYAINAEKGGIVWKFKTEDTIDISPTLWNNRLLVPSSDGKIYMLNPKTGNLLYTFKLGERITSIPIFGDDEIFLCGEKGYIYSFGENGGQRPILLREIGRCPPFSPLKEPPFTPNLANLDLFEEIGVTRKAEAETPQKPDDKKEYVWSRSFDGRITCDPIEEEGRLYLCDSGNKFYTIDGIGNKILWETSIPHKIHTSTRFYPGIILACGDDGVIFALNSNSKEIQNPFKLGGKHLTSPAAANGKIFVGSDDEFIYAINLYKEQILWSHSVPEGTPTPPVILKNHLYVGGKDGNIYAIDCNSGREAWKYKTRGAILFSLAIDERAVYAISQDQHLYAVNVKEGSMTWKFQLPVESVSPPILEENRVYLAGKNQCLYCFNNYTGTLLWKCKIQGNILHAPVPMKKSIYLACSDGSIYIVKKSNGEILRRIELPSQALFKPCIYKNLLFCVCEDNNLYCINMQTESDPNRTMTTPYARLKTLLPPETEDEKRKEETEYKKNLRNAAESEKKEEEIKEGKRFFNVFLLLLPPCIMLASVGAIITGVLQAKMEYIFFSFPALVLSILLYKWNNLKMENRKIKETVGKFVPMGYLRRAMDKKTTEEKEISVVFFDMKNYTNISEELGPSKVYEILKEIDAVTNRIVSKEKGEIMAYTGDAQMVAFNASNPVEDHAEKAINAALEIHRKIQELNRKRKQKNSSSHEIAMTFGINTGPAIIAIRGGENKLEPAALGDTTNVAVRLQQVSREFDYPIIISATTYELVKKKVKVKDLGDVGIKGKKSPMRIYAVIGRTDINTSR